jgi:hypothetical protein
MSIDNQGKLTTGILKRNGTTMMFHDSDDDSETDENR